MDNVPLGNTGRPPDLFDVVNPYALLVFAASCLLATVAVQDLFYVAGHPRAGIAAAALVGTIVPAWLLTRRFRGGIRAQMRLRRPRAVVLAHVVAATLCAVVVVDAIYALSQRFLPASEAYESLVRGLRPDGPGELVVVALGLCVLVPLAEEILFRGFVQQVLERNVGRVTGMVLAGLLFGAAHLDAHLLLSVTAFGLFVGYVFHATRNLTCSVAAHAVFNGVALVQLVASPDGSIEQPPFYLRDERIMVGATILLALLLLRMPRGGPQTGPPLHDDAVDS